MRLTIATWNINSLRLRYGLLSRLIADLDPDVICFQETKVPDALFPAAVPPSLGYPHAAFRGMKGYNGVAIFSRIPFSVVGDTPDWCGRGDCRHLAVALEMPRGKLIIHDFYVPAGGDIPDSRANPKFAHKLAFVREATAHFRANPPACPSVLVGDLNIAPLATDVWSHKQLLKVVSHTPPETRGLMRWQKTGWLDAIRQFVPAEQKLFTWWSYRNQDWRKSDRGRRLDHIWVTPDLGPSLTGYAVLKDARDWEAGSDHVPVSITLDL